MNYAVRITRPYDALQEVVVKFVNACKNVVVYEHEEDAKVARTHCHLLLVGCPVSTDTLKNWIKKRLGDVNKSDWSFKAAPLELQENLGFITYASKGKHEPKFNNLVSPDCLAELTAKWVDPAERRIKYQDGKLVKEVDDAKPVTKQALLQLMIAEIGDTPAGVKDVLRGIRKVLIAQNCVIGQYKVLDYYDAYMMYARKEDWLHVLAARIERRDYPT